MKVDRRIKGNRTNRNIYETRSHAVERGVCSRESLKYEKSEVSSSEFAPDNPAGSPTGFKKIRRTFGS